MSLQTLMPQSALSSPLGGFGAQQGSPTTGELGGHHHHPPSSGDGALPPAIEQLLQQLLQALTDPGVGGAGADTGAGQDPGAASGAGQGGGGLDPQTLQMLACIAQAFEAMMQQQQQGSGDDDASGGGAPAIGGGGGAPAIGGVGGGTPAAGGAAPAGAAPAAAATGAAPAASAPPAAPVDAAASAPAAAASPAPASRGGSADWGPLSTGAQTQANSTEQSAQVAGQYANNLKRDFGLTDAQAAGVVGNLWHESGGMNSGISQGGAIGAFGAHQDDNAHGIGIAQWGGARADGLLQYAATHQDAQGKPLDPTSQAANYGFLKQELSGPYKSAIDAVKQTGTVDAATAAFSDAFEKPTDPQMDSRVAYAQQAMQAMAA